MHTTLLPIIPLAPNTIILPGIVLRIPVPATRPDITAILAHIYSNAASSRGAGQKLDGVHVACVPLASEFLTHKGRRMIGSGSEKEWKKGNNNAGDDGSEKGKEIDYANLKRDELFGYGVASKISGVEGRGTGEFALLVEGVERVRVERVRERRDRRFVEGEVVYCYDEAIAPEDVAAQGLFAHLQQLSKELLTLLRLSSLLPRIANAQSRFSPVLARRLESYIGRKGVQDAGLLADFMTNIIEASQDEKLEVLAALDVKERLEKAVALLQRQVGNIKNNVSFTTITSTSIPFNIDMDQMRQQSQRLRRPGMAGVHLPSGMGGAGQEDDQEVNEMDELKNKLDAAGLSAEAAKVADRELKRLKKMSPAQAEYQVTRNYLENLAEIPWTNVTDDQLGADTLSRARKQLNDDHYGLDKVKKRLLEYLAVLKLKQNLNNDLEVQLRKAEEEKALERLEVLKSKRMVDKSPILLLVGPPGVGKTSLAKSVATALGRKFHRISLGGVRDEAEIRGHRRTYVAAMPGLIVQGLKKVGVANPVFLLDEIDKVGTSNFHGDPSAAMLEVLDPEQNHTFTDHYVNIPIDLSKVIFIATANSLDTIPPPLLDRMETISLLGYTTLEKRHIALQHLIPKQIRTNGLGDGQVEFNQEVVSKIIESYTRESGVRNLEREIGSVCRAKAVEYAEAKDAGVAEQYKPQLSIEDIEDILGIEKFDEEIAEKTSRPGVVTGLVAYSSGGNGSILFIEVADMPGSGSVQLTGKLGDVLKESVEVALSWVKAHAYELALTHDPSENIMKNRSIHVHCPSGAVPKDGPSAGMAHTIALISLFSGRAVRPDLAMTGEISLRGRVTAVGGIKEKLIGALRAGVKTVLLPAQNRKDVKDLPQEVKDGLEIIHVRHIWEAMRHVWPEAHWPGEENFAAIESRL